MARFTASSIARVVACPSSEALPHVRTATSAEAARGTAAHDFLFRLHNGELREEALAAVPDEHREYCASIALEPVVGAIAEVALAYNVLARNARLLHVSNRAYGALAPSEIAGTCDLFIPPQPDSIATVVDWKTTYDVEGMERYAPQLEFYALALARVHRVARIRYEVVAIDERGQPHYVVQRELDFEDLEAIADRLADTWRAVGEATAAAEAHARQSVAPWTPDVTEGEHCRYCPAWRACPAKRAVLEAVGRTPEPNGATYLLVQDIERWAELGRDALREAVREGGPLRIDDQRELRFNQRGSLQIGRRREP